MDYHLRQLERLYHATESSEIGAQLINIYLKKGQDLSDLRHRFPAPLIWDTRMGYQAGKTKTLVSSVSAQLDNVGWKSDMPETMIVGEDWESAFFRAVWPALKVPFLMDEWRNFGEIQNLLLEDIPTVHPEPTLAITHIKVAGSGGRPSSLFSTTKRVPIGEVAPTFSLVEECAYNMFNGALTGPEQLRYGGGGVFGLDDLDEATE